MTTPTTPVRVTIAVTISGETKVFTADATTESNPHRVAEGVLQGLHNDGQEWLREQRYAGLS